MIRSPHSHLLSAVLCPLQMSVLVAQADEQINNIETTAGAVQHDMEQGCVVLPPVSFVELIS
jgi:hypothetical protein